MSEDTQALARTGELRMLMSPAEAQARLIELQSFVQGVLKEGLDYGVIAGTNKPSLLQPGAQKLAEIYGLGWRYVDTTTIERWDPIDPLFFYRKSCLIFSRHDPNRLPICEGVGSCNSREDRYAWRWVFEREIPPRLDRAELVSRTREGKRGLYTQWRIPNADIYSLVNTIEKMAAKRALVSAVIGATRSSDLYTQDAEDLPREAFSRGMGQASSTRSWAREPTQSPESERDPEPKKTPRKRRKPNDAPDAEFDSSPVVDAFVARLQAAQNLQELAKIGAEIGGYDTLSADERAGLRRIYMTRQTDLARAMEDVPLDEERRAIQTEDKFDE